MRLFLSVNFDETTKERFQQIQDRMGKLGSGRFVSSNNYHMTLVFFGSMIWSKRWVKPAENLF